MADQFSQKRLINYLNGFCEKIFQPKINRAFIFRVGGLSNSLFEYFMIQAAYSDA
jgi:hypothetical protein